MNRDHVKEKVLACLMGGIIGDAMGAPVENWRYEKIVAEKGWISDFEGDGTDDSIIKLILIDALKATSGHATADDFAEAFLRHSKHYNWFYIPVRNMFHKIQDKLDLPINAGHDNMASSSSAMSISPMGILNACDPRTAASEAYEVAGLIHSGCCNFCRDAAAAMAAAVAAAFEADATVASVLDAATAYLHPVSAHVMRDKIAAALALAKEAGDYESFRARYYGEVPLYHTICDSRETVPVAFALFYLAGGNPEKAIPYGANFGRDADTIGTMVGALSGAFAGMGGLRKDWVDKITAAGSKQDGLAEDMLGLIEKRCEEKRAMLARLAAI